ncbi:MAG: hypothetical protein WCS34_08880 [Bacteroidales bacterium]
MKTKITFLLMILFSTTFAFAGDYLTNTNQHAAFLRNFARGNSLEIDAAYYNPAGVAFMDDGYYISINNQSAFQTRSINTTYDWDMNGQPYAKKFKGTASAPIIPSVYFIYKNGRLALSALMAVTGGGGTASFADGLPMLNASIITKLKYPSVSTIPSIAPNMYNIATSVDGSQFILGTQVGLSYQVNDWLSVYLGGRMNNFFGSYEGYVDVTPRAEYSQYLGTDDLTNLELDLTQYGWGLTGILAADIDYERWNFMLKYEFKASLNIENKTKKNNTQIPSFDDGVNTPSDIPGFFATALGYDILPTLRASVEFHYYDDKNAGMASVIDESLSTSTNIIYGDKQDYLTHGTREYLFGAEWDITKRLTISGSYQYTDYGLSDNFQQQTSFSCDSYAVGFGARVKVSEKLNMNVGYMISQYSDYTKEQAHYASPAIPFAGTDVFSRTNKVFGFGIDYKF